MELVVGHDYETHEVDVHAKKSKFKHLYMLLYKKTTKKMFNDP